MSIHTTTAAAAAARARHDWREHLDNCAQCSRARHSSARRGARCLGGAMLHAALQAAENQLDYEREQDKRPGPGQAALDLGLPVQMELEL